MTDALDENGEFKINGNTSRKGYKIVGRLTSENFCTFKLKVIKDILDNDRDILVYILENDYTHENIDDPANKMYKYIDELVNQTIRTYKCGKITGSDFERHATIGYPVSDDSILGLYSDLRNGVNFYKKQ
jgi:hypothetical protein